ncbi:MAG: hypothetical protein QOI38_2224 [Sphingomonadales bacterium]|jgi:hypothetical protein|nr:hypothetical protein [Sphingomonadales bacterium]
MRLVAALVLLAASGCAAAPRPLTAAELEFYPEARGMPADVQDYIVRWQGCAHFLGEPWGDEDRRRQIERGIRVACPGIDALGRAVRRRHAGEPEVLARIAELEPLGQ